MAVGIYRGVGNVARKVKAEYRGVGNVARKVFGSTLKLYDYGDECSADSGGWTPLKWRGSFDTLTRTKKSNHLYAYGTTGLAVVWAYLGWGTTKKIDVSGYSKLKAVIAGGNNYDNTGAYVALMNELIDEPMNDSRSSYPVVKAERTSELSTAESTIELDLTDVTGEYYIGAYACTYNPHTDNTYYASLYVYKIWLE